MADEVKRCVESCREWYQAFSNMGKGNEPSVKELLTTADLIKSLAAELEQVKRERDAAVEDVAKLKRCEHCIGYEEFLKIDGNIERCNACEERSHWQWRGAASAGESVQG